MLEAGQCPLGNCGHTTPHRRCAAPDMTHCINETIFWFISGTLLLDCSLKEWLSFCFHSLKIRIAHFKITWFVLSHPSFSDGILIFSIFFTTQHAIIKKSFTTKRAFLLLTTMKMSFEPIFYCRFNCAAWHLLTKSWSDIIWAVIIIILNSWLVFSVILLSPVCVFWGHISLYCCKLI